MKTTLMLCYVIWWHPANMLAFIHWDTNIPPCFALLKSSEGQAKNRFNSNENNSYVIKIQYLIFTHAAFSLYDLSCLYCPK